MIDEYHNHTTQQERIVRNEKLWAKDGFVGERSGKQEAIHSLLERPIFSRGELHVLTENWKCEKEVREAQRNFSMFCESKITQDMIDAIIGAVNPWKLSPKNDSHEIPPGPRLSAFVPDGILEEVTCSLAKIHYKMHHDRLETCPECGVVV
jgi:hypothetical protein